MRPARYKYLPNLEKTHSRYGPVCIELTISVVFRIGHVEERVDNEGDQVNNDEEDVYADIQDLPGLADHVLVLLLRGLHGSLLLFLILVLIGDLDGRLDFVHPILLRSSFCVHFDQHAIVRRNLVSGDRHSAAFAVSVVLERGELVRH